MASKIILHKDQVNELILQNKYPINPKTKFLSRCIDGRYKNKKNLEVLAYPGADPGELALVLATGNAYGFEVDLDLAYQSLLNVIQGVENFHIHTDTHERKGEIGAGCGHLRQIKTDPKAYNLEDQQIEELFNKLKEVKEKGAKEVLLKGEHMEGAILQIKGNYGVYPQSAFVSAEGRLGVQVFVYHQTLVDERHKAWVRELIKNQAVRLFKGCDEEYLYEALSEVSETHLLETAKRLAHGFLIYSVGFDKGGNFTLKEMGRV